MKMTASILFSLVIGALTMIPAPAIHAAQVTFDFEGGNNGTVNGVEYGTPHGNPPLKRNGFVIDVAVSSPSTNAVHFHEVDSRVTDKVPDRPPANRGVLWRDSIAGRDPLFFVPDPKGAFTFALKSLYVGASTADGSQTTGVQLSAILEESPRIVKTV